MRLALALLLLSGCVRRAPLCLDGVCCEKLLCLSQMAVGESDELGLRMGVTTHADGGFYCALAGCSEVK